MDLDTVITLILNTGVPGLTTSEADLRLGAELGYVTAHWTGGGVEVVLGVHLDGTTLVNWAPVTPEEPTEDAVQLVRGVRRLAKQVRP